MVPSERYELDFHPYPKEKQFEELCRKRVAIVLEDIS
jgi:hypothetical protein